jgi:hypothetical protein
MKSFEPTRLGINKLFFLTLLVIGIPWFLICTRWGFDEIHEGQLLLSVKSIESGLTIHRDFFEYKGLLSPLFYSFFHPDSMPLVLTLRLITSLLIFSSAILAFFYVKRFSTSWAFTLGIAWILLSPPVMLWSSKPWPNKVLIDPGVLTTFIVVLCIFLISNEGNGTLKLQFSTKHVMVAFAILLGLLPWNRIQNLFFSVGAALLVLTSSKFAKRAKVKFFTLYVFSLIFPLLYLNQKQALGAWYQQIIKTPINLGSQSSPMVQMTPWQILTTGFTFLFLALTFLTLCITISRLRSIFFGKSLPLSFISTAILAIIACYFALRYQIDPELNNSPKNWSLLAIQWLPLGFWHLTAILGVFLVSAGTMRFLYLKVVRAKVIQPWLDSFEIKLVFLACINSLLFIYPNVGNLWTSALPISIFVLKILHLKSLESNKVTRQMLFSNSVGKSAQILLLSLSVLGLGLIPVANSRCHLSYCFLYTRTEKYIHSLSVWIIGFPR